ncbi:hypothetical protein GCM10027578_30690 [Spirosoma luteolum]
MKKTLHFVLAISLLLLAGTLSAQAQTQHSEETAAQEDAPGSLSATPSALTGFATKQGKPSAPQKFTLSGTSPYAGLRASPGVQISQSETGGYTDALEVQGLPTTIWVRLDGSNVTAINGGILLQGAPTRKPGVQLEVPIKGVVE